MFNHFCVAFVRRAFIFGAIIAILACSASVLADTASSAKPLKIAPAGVIRVAVVNKSATCVWVSVAYATYFTPWQWMSGKDTAQFIKPNASRTFEELHAKVPVIPHDSEAKVEGTFMKNPDCSGGHARSAITVENKDLYQTPLGIARATAELTGQNPSSYNVKIFPNR